MNFLLPRSETVKEFIFDCYIMLKTHLIPQFAAIPPLFSEPIKCGELRPLPHYRENRPIMGKGGL